MEITNDGNFILSGSKDYSLKIHDIEKKLTIKSFEENFEGN